MDYENGSVVLQLWACLLIFLSSLAAFLVTMSLVSNSLQASALAKELSRIVCCGCSSLVYDTQNDDTDNCNQLDFRWIHQCEATIEMASDHCEHHHAVTSSMPTIGNYQTYSSDHKHNNISPLLDHHHHHDHPHDTIRELYESNVSTPLVLIRCMAAGIILGVAIMHLMADGQQFLQTQISLATYPLGLLFLGIGIFITLGIDQIAMSSMASAMANRADRELQGIEDVEMNNNYINDNDKSSSSSISKSNMIESEGEAVSDADRKALVKAYILEAGVAVHSVILGFGLGTMSKTTAIEVLVIVLVFHQVLEGIGLGTVMAETCLTARMKIVFAIIFGLTLPIGTLLGISIKQSAGNSPQGDIIEGIMNTLAAGSLVYTSMVEMIASEFQFSVNAQKASGSMKGLMFMSLVGGFAIMSILAIWG